MHDAAPPLPEGLLPAGAAEPARRRPAAGERRTQILKALASMLEQPGGERITTASLAARLQLSEAALYRHFASKAQMFEALIDFIESSLMTMLNRLADVEPDPARRAGRGALLVLQFAEANPGLARVLAGDALAQEHERLAARVVQLLDKLETGWRHALRQATDAAGRATPSAQAQWQAAALAALVVGRMHAFVRTGFRLKPSDGLEPALAALLAS